MELTFLLAYLYMSDKLSGVQGCDARWYISFMLISVSVSVPVESFSFSFEVEEIDENSRNDLIVSFPTTGAFVAFTTLLEVCFFTSVVPSNALETVASLRVDWKRAKVCDPIAALDRTRSDEASIINC